MIKNFNTSNSTFIIAEVGVNHNGNMDIAYELIDEVAKTGADAIKFQAAIPELVTTSYAAKANYQKKTTKTKETQLEMLNQIHLPLKALKELQARCKAKGMLFFASAFDMESLKFIESLNQPLHKIPSGEITNLPYLREIASFKRPTIISTGMSSLSEIEAVINVFDEAKVSREYITILHCNTEYPSPMKDLNLRAIQSIKSHFHGIQVGYSDHSMGIEVPIAAVSLGASVIEKHITLDRNLVGPDHMASIEPKEFKAMVSAIRNIEKALGKAEKVISHSEKKNLKIARRSIVASKEIKKGEIFTQNNIIAKRPGSGLSPMFWDEVIGKIAKKTYKKDQQIKI